MPFLSLWGRVLHVLVHMFLTRVTRVPMNQRQVIPVVVCGQSAHWRWRRCGGERSGSVLRDWGYRCSWQTEPFLLSGLSKAFLGVDAWPSWDLATLSGVKHFARDQRLRLETRGWRVLDFEGNPLSESELEWQKEHILRGPLVVPDREYPFTEDLIVDDESGAPDATLPVLAKVSSLIEILRLGRPYELVNQMWSQFTLIASRVNIDVAWSRDKVLVGIVLLLVATYTCSLAYWCCILVDHLEWNVPPHRCSCVWLGEESWEVQHRVRRMRFRDLGPGVDIGEVHISTCLRCHAEPV